MDKTPKGKNNKYPNNPTKPAGSESPMQLKCPSRNDHSFECSPILSQCTSDNYDVDVIWDWNSPRTKTNVRRGKRHHVSEQEKPPLKKTPSGNHLPTFDQLKRKLEALKEEITAEKKDEKLFNLSCVNTGHSTNGQIYHNNFIREIPELEELFNDDSFEEQLILCGQKVENHLIKPSNLKIKTNECKIDNLQSASHNIDTKNNGVEEKATRISTNINAEVSKPKKFNFKPSNKAQAVCLKDIFDVVTSKPLNIEEKKVNKTIEDDSFDSALALFEDDDMDLLNEVNTLRSKTAKDGLDDKSKCLKTGIESSPSSPQKTSFDDSFLKHKSTRQNESLSKETLEEIERKRKEALAKLEAKRKTPLSTPVEQISLLKCSLEETAQSKAIHVRFKERSKCLETGIKHLPKSPQFRKTTSFDDSFLNAGSSKQESLSKETLEEIERKRKEALAKLEAKRKTPVSTPVDETSPIKCSQEEIEQKRLQALAKREAKKKQEIIERNRLEALKRLEINKKKKVLELQNTNRTTPKTLPYNIAENNR